MPGLPFNYAPTLWNHTPLNLYIPQIPETLAKLVNAFPQRRVLSRIESRSNLL